MYYYEKTILTCYKSITPITNQLENLIVKKAKNSFYDYTPCKQLAENLLKFVNARLDLLELKFLTDEAIKKLNEEDKILIEYKYFKNKYLNINYINNVYKIIIKLDGKKLTSI